MIATIAAFAVMLQNPAAQADTSGQAAQLISKMLAHYYKAKKLSGTILLTTTAGKSSGRLLTTVQFDDPSKIFIRQDLQAETQRTWMIVSDGTTFTYPLPESQLGSDLGKNLYERVTADGEQRGFRDIYAIGASGLKDRSAPLDVAIGRYEDLKYFKGHLASFSLGQPVQLRGKLCQVVEGGWKVKPNAATAESKYKLTISDEGDLMRYELLDNIVDPASPPNMIQIRQIWDVDFHLNGETREDLYRL